MTNIILIADEERSEALKTLLEKIGCEVQSAKTFAKGRVLLMDRKIEVDCVVLTESFPGSTQFPATVRAESLMHALNRRGKPVIILSRERKLWSGDSKIPVTIIFTDTVNWQAQLEAELKAAMG